MAIVVIKYLLNIAAVGGELATAIGALWLANDAQVRDSSAELPFQNEIENAPVLDLQHCQLEVNITDCLSPFWMSCSASMLDQCMKFRRPNSASSRPENKVDKPITFAQGRFNTPFMAF